MARTASRWGTRPSSLLGLVDDVTAYALDEALDMRLTVAELTAEKHGDRRPPPDVGSATDADAPDSDWG